MNTSHVVNSRDYLQLVATSQPDRSVWIRLLSQLEYMVRAANQSGLRMPARRGRGHQWCIYPREYLQLCQQFAQGPEWVRAAVREITMDQPRREITA